MILESFIVTLGYFFVRLSKKLKATIVRARIWLLSVIILEIILRISGVLLTYPEITDGRYISSAEQEYIKTWYWVHQPKTRINNPKKEFLFCRNVNSIGLSEKEIEPIKKVDLRILALGDSFTEGVGTSKDSTFIQLTAKNYIKQGYSVEGINAGIGGSDPVYSYKLFKDKLLIYQPDILLLTINSTDVNDISRRGGFERFNSNGTTGVPPPSWDWLYGCNHIARFVAHAILRYSRPFTGTRPLPQEKSLSILINTLNKFSKLCEKQNIKLLVILQPSHKEFPDNKFQPYEGYDLVKQRLNKDKIHYFELSNYFQYEAKKSKRNLKDFFWSIDTHYNPLGYTVFANGVITKLDELKWISNPLVVSLKDRQY
jgi:hypothetical protein